MNNLSKPYTKGENVIKSEFAKVIKKAQKINFIQHLKTSVFFQQVSLTFGTRTFIFIIGFASSIITARYLGPEGKGILAVLMTITGIISQFGNFGFHAANTYFVAKDRGKLTKIIGNTLWLSLLGGSIISLITLGIFFINHNFLTNIPFYLILFALLAMPFNLLFMLGQNIFLGIQKIKVFNFLELTRQLTTFLIIAMLLVLLHQGVKAVVITNTVFAVIFSLLVLNVLQPIGGNVYYFDFNLFKKMIRYGIKAYLAALFAFLVIRFDMLMVNYYLGSNDAGVYSIAANIADILYMLPVSFGMILFPKVSGMKEGSWEFTKKVAWVTTLIMFFVCSFVALIAKPFIIFFYGNAFSGTIEALWWLLPGIFALSIETVIVQFLNSIGLPISVVFYWLIGFLINLLLNMIFIPNFGIIGASITSSISYILLFILILYKTLRINININDQLKKIK